MSRLSTRTLVTILLALLALGFSSLPARLGVVGAVVMEVLLVIAGAALAVRAASPWLGARQRALAVLIAALAIGQIARSKKAFPFMPYTMYGRAAEGDALFYEYTAQHRSGARDRFRPSVVIATLGRARIVKGLARELDAYRESKGSLDRASQLMRALVAEQNRDQADPITQVDVEYVTLPPPYEHPTRQLVASIPTP